VIAVGLGVSPLGERPGAGAVAGLLLILAGSWLSTDGRLPPDTVDWARRVWRPVWRPVWRTRAPSRGTGRVHSRAAVG
jgi:hypothetical protein